MMSLGFCWREMVESTIETNYEGTDDSGPSRLAKTRSISSETELFPDAPLQESWAAGQGSIQESPSSQ